MTEICREIITHKSAWTSTALGGKEAITRELTPQEIDAFADVIGRTRDLAPQAVTREQFTHPTLDRLLAEVKSEVMDGRSVILVRGLDPTRFSPEDFERIYWGIGLHLGIPAVQSRTGDRLGRVEEDDRDPVSRGYRSSSELHMHTDSYEVVGLLCVQRAASGGQSGIVSSLAIHNEMLRTRPVLLDALYEGFYMAIPEAKTSSKPITDEKIPVFSYRDGKVSCMFAGSFMRSAAKQMDVPLPGKLGEALDYFSQLAERDDLALRFTLEPGDMLIWHNFMNLHSRTNFDNDADHKRLLLRLWLKIPDGRPFAPEFHARGAVYDRVYSEHRVTESV